MIYRSETSRHRHRFASHLGPRNGCGLDLGSGGDPICPTAIQVELEEQYTPDLGGAYPVQLRGDATRLRWFADGVFDYVYSSHLLEDFAEWEPVLREWVRVLKPGGHLLLLIPDKDRFAAAVANGQPPNIAHRHEGRIGELTEYANILGLRVIEDRYAGSEDDYNIIFVGEKK